MKIVAADQDMLPTISALCLRSKAHWGYDEAFMAACVDVLTFTPDDLTKGPLVVAMHNNIMAGMCQVSVVDNAGELEHLFVEPAHIGTGVGRFLFDWAIENLRQAGATALSVTSDPHAAAFYRHVGCQEVGHVPSNAIAGRFLPRLVYKL